MNENHATNTQRSAIKHALANNTAATAFIGLGSNQQHPQLQVIRACTSLALHPQIQLLAVSPWYSSKAVGPEQPDYINGAVKICTSLAPEPLLDALQTIENQQGRVRTQHWGPRTLDLDLLLYGEQTINSERLKVPHPYLAERNFVLQPLLAIEPSLHLPDGRAINTIAWQIGTENLFQL
ncbi:2-amino-4-hydroxy-6-hydroxymethyldihydropteridine diphosphokinase [Teredinibacter waterburyi]|jgi:2-amino-4-hydroxy-6-hydroxymethyldihydropteridine pyrophosphokinase|uniref:2-amino-4-hydroxy-6- hydroxymethyldihydropteridine diphosphokinase n=1 Tax=Teredinibacter waterburyi TaxID=1500538 RepID=UPI00165F2B6E|nr:2-amino-4-hydroxy-6-hydroxymethyldihydropteridine diphosphokinase [Teredinibacter waterburyi]